MDNTATEQPSTVAQEPAPTIAQSAPEAVNQAPVSEVPQIPNPEPISPIVSEQPLSDPAIVTRNPEPQIHDTETRGMGVSIEASHENPQVVTTSEEPLPEINQAAPLTESGLTQPQTSTVPGIAQAEPVPVVAENPIPEAENQNYVSSSLPSESAIPAPEGPALQTPDPLQNTAANPDLTTQPAPKQGFLRGIFKGMFPNHKQQQPS